MSDICCSAVQTAGRVSEGHLGVGVGDCFPALSECTTILSVAAENVEIQVSG